MIETDTKESKIGQLAEEHYVPPPASLDECYCEGEHRLSVALSEQRGRPELFRPGHKGINDAYCATFGRRCGIY